MFFRFDEFWDIRVSHAARGSFNHVAVVALNICEATNSQERGVRGCAEATSEFGSQPRTVRAASELVWRYRHDDPKYKGNRTHGQNRV